ncbi:MAG: hypothetical protein LBB50_03555, partial [Oscillospiraceae bacterium]|nr:hypothetical protein [Oscillospiraceae bacterium]
MGERGPQGLQGDAAEINSLRVVLGEPGTQPYVYNAGTRSLADFVMVIPAAENGANGATGPAGPQGRNGRDAYGVYGGLYNNHAGEFEMRPDEVVAMTFSEFLPRSGVWYDDHHSVVVEEGGVYEIRYALRAESVECGRIELAITSDGAVIPSSVTSSHVSCREDFEIVGFTLAELPAGAHLHFVISSRNNAKFKL